MEKSFGIIGYGKLGQALAVHLHKNKRLDWICSESNKEISLSGLKFYHNINEIETPADVIFICKADSFIEQTAINFSKHFGKKLRDKIIIHSAGVLPLEILNSCVPEGAIIAKAHPFQTFYFASDTVFEKVHWVVEANRNYEEIKSIIKILHGTAHDINEIKGFNPVLYHISAVIASNYMNTIIRAAFDAAKTSGIPPAEFLPVILRTTLENNISAVEKSEESLPLTGPIARGDIKTIKLHLDTLLQYEDLLEQYCRIGLATAEIARQQNLISLDTFNEIIILFNKRIVNTTLNRENQ